MPQYSSRDIAEGDRIDGEQVERLQRTSGGLEAMPSNTYGKATP